MHPGPWAALAAAAAASALGALIVARRGAAPMPPATRADSSWTALPPPRTTSATSLEQALAMRRSVREYTGAPLDEREIAQLLWAAQGITHGDGLRTAPSAGALYPLEISVVTARGVFQYAPVGHRWRVRITGDRRAALGAAAHGQAAVSAAPAVFVIAAVDARTAAKYGRERGRRYADLEAGHAAQNLLLQAAALGLGAVPMGAFSDDDVARVVGLPRDERPVYLIPVGHPR